MPTILNFTNLTSEQVHETIAVFAGHKEDTLLAVPVLPREHLVYEDDLPDLSDLTGAVLNWADPNIQIVLAILALRQGIHNEEFRLFTVHYGHLVSWHLIPRYNKFCRPTADEDEQERGFLIGAQPLSFSNHQDSIELILWERMGTVYEEIMSLKSATGSPLFLRLPGDWWGKFEFGEELSPPVSP